MPEWLCRLLHTRLLGFFWRMIHLDIYRNGSTEYWLCLRCKKVRATYVHKRRRMPWEK